MNNSNVPHLFIYDEGTAQNKDYFTYGEMNIIEKSLKKTTIINEYDDFLLQTEAVIQRLRPDKNGLIIYIHGYLGDNEFFMEKSGYVLHTQIMGNATTRYGMALSLQWKTVIPYGGAYVKALASGEKFAYRLQDIYQVLRKYHPAAPVSFICHSMGNRVFQSIYETWVQIEPELKLNKVLFMAADLENDIFETAFKNIEKHTEDIIVYHKNQDVTLKIATSLNHYTRLGLTGPKIGTEPSNCTVRDASDIDDDKSFAGTITHHRYFYGSKTVRKEIVDWLKK
ncbi:MAG: alpha/beta hydrolase [Saprospiraceae bacterium]|nr:MAG: hypothetical protein UZ09_BCD002000788 [Bacteroidetes bacterium OLB9]MCO6462627.1 alpha/beta hydrolase [Saprospiraceae bacterium]